MSSLAFTDNVGPATLTNGYPGPGGRFSAWQSDAPLMSVEAEQLGDGTLHVFEFHAKQLATFELRDIPESQVAVAMRLILHLNRGGTVTVATDDQLGRTYTCQKPKEGKPQLGPPDPKTLRRTLKLTLRNTDPTEPMLCLWD